MTIDAFFEKIQTRAAEAGALCREIRDDDPNYWHNYGMVSAFSKAEYYSTQELNVALAESRARRDERKRWGDWRKAGYYSGLATGLGEVLRIRRKVSGLDEHIKGMIDEACGSTTIPTPIPRPSAHSAG